MPGCWAIYPAQSNSKRFASLCGEGNVTTVTLNDGGQEATRTSSGKFFYPDSDAIMRVVSAADNDVPCARMPA